MSEQAKEKLGVNEIVDVLDLALGVEEALVKSFKDDGKIGPNDLQHLLPVALKIQPVIEGGDMIIPQLKDVDSAEAAQLVAHVVSKLTVDEPKARLIVEKALLAAKANFDLVMAIRS